MIDAVQLFEDYANLKGWKFSYGERVFQDWAMKNTDFTDGDNILVMFPVIYTGNASDTTILDNWNGATKFWLGRKFDNTAESGTYSNLDETETQKFNRRLKTMQGLLSTMIKEVFCGEEIELQSARMYRELNVTTENIDFVTLEISFLDPYA